MAHVLGTWYRLMVRVRPGVFEVTASFFLLWLSELSADDLPTLDRPAKAISGRRNCGISFTLPKQPTNSRPRSSARLAQLGPEAQRTRDTGALHASRAAVRRRTGAADGTGLIYGGLLGELRDDIFVAARGFRSRGSGNSN